MPIQLSVTVRNAMLNAIESAIGQSAILRLREGAQPADTSSANSGTVVATFNLQPDWMAAAASGAISFSNAPLVDTAADNTAVVGHYRVYASDGTTCHMQGSVTATGGGGDMTIASTSVTAGEQVRVTSWTINMADHA